MEPHSSLSNGIAKYKNRKRKEMMNTMLISSGLPQNLWKEGILSINHILNKIPHKSKIEIPYTYGKVGIFLQVLKSMWMLNKSTYT